MTRAIAALCFALLLSSCSEDPCEEQSGSVLCGYCDQDAATTSNPHAGMCRYCPGGSTCTGDICGDMSCVVPVDGGGGNTCQPGVTCINNLCSPGLWCCPAGHSCNMGACGCN